MAPSIALRHAIGLWALILAGGPVVAGEVSATGGALGLGTAVNGQLGGSCGLGLCQVGGGTAAGRNLFHRFSAFDTRGGITGVNFSTGGAQNVFVGVTSPLGSFIDKLVSFSSPGNLFWLSPGGIAISGAGGFANIQQLNLSTATGWRVGNGVFDAAGTTAGQAALLSGAPVSGLAGAVNDPATLAALGIQKNGDLSIAGGLLTVDQGLLLDAQGGNVLLQAARLQAKGGSVEIQGQSVRQDAPIESSGTSGGSVTINAAGALTNGAPIQANGSSAGGTINLQAGTSLTSSSAITATGTGPMAKGGTIELTAPSVTLAAAQVDASGAGGGGVIRVGGGVQGSPLSLGGANAINTMVDSSSSLKADTTQAGNGGQVVVWAERATLVDGAISARGGPAGGDGGFVETSGREQLAVSRAPDASAPLGKGGTWLLDPNNLTVNASGPDSNVSGFPNATTTGDSAVIAASTINAALNAGTSVSLATSAGGAQAGDITVSAPISKTAGGAASLSLSAHNNINLNANISSLAGALNLNLVANSDNVGGGSVQRQTSGTFIDLNGGNLNLAGNGDFTLIDDFRNLRFDKSGTGSYLAPFFVRLTGVTIGTDMTFSNEVGIVNDLLLANGVTVNKEANIWRFGTTGLRTLGLAPGATSATVISSGGFILAGQGVIGQTLTIGPGVTLQSSGAGTTQLRDSTASTIINNGTIASTTGGTWSILPAGFINNGAVTANNGTVSISSTSWSNGSTGVFNVGPSGTLNLGGTFTNANPGASNRTGGSVFIPGTFDLAGATLDVGSAGLFGSGGLTQLSGTLLGGTLINTDTTPVLTSGLGTLNGMTIGSNVGINGTLRIANDLLLTNGVTVNKGANNWNFVTTGVRTLGLAPGASSATVSSSGGAIFAGSGVSGQTLTIGPGVTLQSSGAGTTTLTNSSAAPIINNGTIASTTGGTWSITPTSFTNGATGTLVVSAGSTLATANNSFSSDGAIQGSGTINVGTGTVTNNGTIKPGGTGAAGTLNITGNFVSSASGIIEAELGGTTAGSQYDRLAVSGNVTLGGTLNSPLINGFVPSGQSFDVITAGGTATGSFASSNLPSGFNGAIVGSVYRLTNSGLGCLGICWDGGGGDTSWENVANWGGDLLPTAIDVAYLNLVGGVDVTLSSSQSVKGLNSIAGNNLTINSGGSLTLNDSGTSSSLNGGLTINGGTLGGTGDVTVSGAFDVTSSSYLSGPGLFTTQGTSTVNMPSELGGYLNLEGGKNWVNEGTLTIGGDDLIYFGFVGGGANTLTNAVGATLNLSSAAGTPLSYWAGTAEVINAGTLNQTVVGAHTIDVNFNNTGTVNVDVGTLSIGGSGSDSGSYAVDAGTTLNFSSGTRDLNAGSNITGLGTLSVSGATVNANNLLDIASTGTPLTVASGALNLNGSAITGTLAPVSISGGALNVNTTNPITLPSLVLSGGTLGGTGDVTVSGAFDVTSSSYLSGPGLFTTQGTSTVNMPSELGGYLNLEGGKNWVNEGTLTIGGDDLIYFGFVGGGANTLTNAVGATLNLSSAAGTPLSYWAGTAEVINAGTLNQTVVGAHTIDVNFNNTGTVNVDVGTLSIGGSGSDSGSYAVDAGTTLNFSSGTRDLNAGSNITGLGTLSVSGATVNANIALDFLASGTSLSVSNNGSLYVNSGLTVGNLPLDGGTLGGTGDVTVSGAFDVTSFSYLSGPGLFTTQGTSTVNMPSELGGYLNLEGGKNWVNEGTLTIGGDDLIYFGFVGGGANTLTNAVGATLNLSSAAGTPLSYWAGTAEVINAGTLNQTVVGAHTIDVNFNNTGTVNVDVGTLSIGGSGSDSGSYAVDAGTTLNFSSGTRDLNAGSNITGLGTLSVSGATVNANNLLDIASTGTPLTVASGALNLNGSAITGTLAPVSISGGALNVNTTNPITLPSLVLSGGTLGGTGDVTVSGAFDVTSSSYLSGPGLFTTQGTSTVNMPSELGGYLNLEGGKNWVNEGTLTIGGDDLIYFGFVGGGANTLTNAVGATLNLSSAAGTPLSYWAGTAEVINAGTLNQTVVGAHTIDVNFNNTGTVNVDVGTLSIGGSGSDSGSYAVDAGTTLNFSSGTRDLNAGSNITGLGTLSVSGATVNANIALDFLASGTSLSVSNNGSLYVNSGLTVGNLPLDGGTLGGTGDVTVSGAFDVTSFSYLSGPGLFTTQGTSTVNMPSELGGYLNLEGGKNWVNEGTLTIGGDDLIYFGFVGGGANTLTNAVGATLNLSSAAGTPLSYWAGTAEVINAGTLNQTVVGAHTIDVNFNNTGTVNVDVGTLSIGGSGSDSGSYAVDAGTTLNFSSGTRDLNAGSNITGLGTLSVSGATVNANIALDFLASGTSLSVSNNGSLYVNSGLTVGNLPLDGGTLGGTGDVTVSGAFDVTSFSYLSGPGLFTTQGTSTVNMPSELGGYLNLEGGKNWVNEGTLTIGGDDLIYFGFVGGGANTLTNAVGATLNLSSAAGTPLSYWAGTAEVINAGTLNQTVVGAHTIDVNFNNTGTVNVDVGTLSIGGSGSDSGSYAVDAGTTLNFSSGTRDLNAGSNITGLGTLSVSGATVNANIALDFLASGTSLSVSNNGSLYVNSGLTVGNLPLDGGTLGGTGDVTVSGAFDVTSFSYLSGPGLFTTQGTSTVNMPSELGGYLNLEGGKNWVNEGTLTIGGDDLIYFGFVGGGANTLTNAVGATLNLSSAAGTPLSYWAGTAEVINAGTLNQTVVGAHTIDVNFNNTGTVNVDVGTLSIGGSGSDSGSYAVDAGTTLNFSSGTRDLNAGSNITGLGTLSVSGATVNANSGLTIGSNLQLDGGTLGGTGDVTVSGAFDVTSSSYLSGPGLFTTQGTSTVNMPSVSGGSLNISNGKNWVNEGTLTIGGDDLIYFGFVGGGANTLTNAVGATLNLSSAAGTPLSYWAGTAEVINAGTLNQTVVGAHTIDVNFNNTGTVNVDVGTLSIGGSLTQSGAIDVAAGAVFQKSGGFTNASTGTLSGFGTIDVGAGNTLTNLGTISPGGDGVAGALSITGVLALSSTSVLNLDLGGATPGSQYDRLAVSGNVNLGGTINTQLINGFSPSLGQNFDVITSGGTATGSFAGSNLPSGFNGAIVFGSVYRLTNSGLSCLGVCWDGGGGDTSWETLANWSGDQLPTTSDVAYLNLVGGVDVTLSSSQSVKGLNSIVGNNLTINSGGLLTLNDSGTSSTLNGELAIYDGALTTNGALTLNGNSVWAGGTLAGAGSLTVGSGATLVVGGGSGIVPGTYGLSRLTNQGTVQWLAEGLNYSADGVIDNSGLFDVEIGDVWDAAGSFTFAFNNLTGGELRKSGLGISFLGSVNLTNNGLVDVRSGTLVVSPNSLIQNNGLIQTASDASFQVQSDLTNASTGTLSGGIEVYFGTLINFGTISPGGDGVVGVIGADNLILGSTSVLNLDIGGATGSQYDRLFTANVVGNASLDGTINAQLINGYSPSPGQNFDVILSATTTGSFASSNLPSGFNGAIVGSVYRLTNSGLSCLGVCWDGGGGTTGWETLANWSGDQLPTTTDVAYLNLVGGVDVTLSSSQSVKGLNSLVANNLTINSGGSLTLNDPGTASNLAGDLTVNGTLNIESPLSASSLALNGGALGGSGSLTVSNAFTRTGGTTGTSLTGVTLNQASGDLSPGAWSVNGPVSFTAAAGNLLIDGPVTATTLLGRGATGLTLQPGVVLNATASTGSSLVLEAGTGAFTNLAGAGALAVAPGARWLVYSASPLTDNRGGLSYAFKQYGITYGSATPVVGAGNGFLYGATPTVTASLTGSISKTYDGTVAAPLAAGNYLVTGAIDSDTVQVNNPTLGTYTSAGTGGRGAKDAGSGKDVSAAGVAITGASEGAVAVYGYQLASSTATGTALGTINPLALTGAAIAPSSSIYGSALSPGAVSFSNVFSGDLVGATASVNTGGVSSSGNSIVGAYTQTVSTTLSGSDAANYSFSGFTSTPNYTISPLALTGAAIASGSSIYGSALAPGAVSFGNLLVGDLVGATASVNTGGVSSSGNSIVGAYTQSAGTTLIGGDAANYSFSGFTSTPNYTISPLALTGAAIGSGSSIYGSALTPGAVSFGNLFSGDLVGAAAAVNTSTLSTGGNPIVGAYTQSASTALSGSDAANYSFSGFTSTPNYTISPLALTGAAIASGSSTYGSALTPGAVSFGNLFSGDLVGSAISVNTSILSTGGQAIVGGYTQSASTALSGSDAANYSFSGFTSASIYTISPLDLTATGVLANNKVYDGNTVATISTSGATLTGLIAGDRVALAGGTGLFADANVGLAKPVAVSGLGLGGTDAANYSLLPSSSLSADIAIRPLATWSASTAGNWSDPANWDALPSGSNVAAVAIPVGSGALTYDAAAGSTNLQSLFNDQNLSITGGSLAVSGATSVASGASLSLNGGSFSTATLINEGLVNGSGPLALNGTYTENGGSLGSNFSSVAITQTSGDLNLSGVGATGPVSLSSSAGGLNLSGAVSSAGGPISLSSSGPTLLASGSLLTSPGALISVSSGGPLSLLGARVDASGSSAGGTVQLDGSSLTLTNATLNTSGASDGGLIQLGLKTLPSSTTITNSSLVADPPGLGGTITIDGRAIALVGSTLNVVGLSGGSILLGSANTATLSLDAATSLVGGGGASFSLFAGSIVNNASIIGGRLFVNGVDLGAVTVLPDLPSIEALPAEVAFQFSVDLGQSSPLSSVDYTAPGSLLVAQWEQVGIDPLSISLSESAFLFADTWMTSAQGPLAVWDSPTSGSFAELFSDLALASPYGQPLQLDPELLSNPVFALEAARSFGELMNLRLAQDLFPSAGAGAGAGAVAEAAPSLLASLMPAVEPSALRLYQDLYPSAAISTAWPPGPVLGGVVDASTVAERSIQLLSSLQVMEQFTAADQRALAESAVLLADGSIYSQPVQLNLEWTRPIPSAPAAAPSAALAATGATADPFSLRLLQALFPSTAFNQTWPSGAVLSLSGGPQGLFDRAVQQLSPQQVNDQFTSSEQKALEDTASKLGLEGGGRVAPSPAQLQQSLREVIQAVRRRISGR